jgi:hypothetical protein
MAHMPPDRSHRGFGTKSARLRRSPADAQPAPARLTPRQQQILDSIRGFIEVRGMPPTRVEIAAGLGFSTPSSAEDHLQALAKKGVIELVPGASRGLRIKEIPIPTYYGDEISHLNPLTYGLRVLRVMWRFKRGVYGV